MAARFLDGYFKYLLNNYLGIDTDTQYRKLLWHLYSTPYQWDHRIELDADRAEDGKSLRLSYFNDMGLRSELSGKQCSVLEMLISVSVGMESIMGDPENYHPARWFWEIIDNLGLTSQDEYCFDKEYVGNVLTIFMSRSYDKNGLGGAFPLYYSSVDQRQVPIWEQACAYLTERY